jgi:predicted metal-dependent hydrolase
MGISQFCPILTFEHSIYDQQGTKMPVGIDRIVRSKRRTLTLIVENDGSLTVRAPLRVSGKMISEFVEGNSLWIEKKRAQARLITSVPPKQYVPGELFPFLGQSHALEVVKDQKKALLLDGNFKLAESAQASAQKAFEVWYRKQARRIITEHAVLFAAQYDFQYEKIRISSARTRWGSCSPSGTLSFSWRLILTPMEVVDYVIIHELVHTLVHNHSKRFWKKVEKILPDYKEYNKWLRKNGRKEMV